MTIERVCEVCGHSLEWHRQNQTAHVFSDDGRIIQRSRSQASDPVSEENPRMQLAGDPVLRMALIRKGVITPEDLDEVENELRATGISHT